MLDTVIIARGAFVLKAAFMRETNSNSSRAAHFFFFGFCLKKKNVKGVAVMGGGLFAYCSSKPSITCHMELDFAEP